MNNTSRWSQQVWSISISQKADATTSNKTFRFLGQMKLIIGSRKFIYVNIFFGRTYTRTIYFYRFISSMLRTRTPDIVQVIRDCRIAICCHKSQYDTMRSWNLRLSRG